MRLSVPTSQRLLWGAGQEVSLVTRFLETVDRAAEELRRRGRVSLRALAREFSLGEGALDDLAEELVDVRRVAELHGTVLIAKDGADERAVRPEGERRQLTTLFCDVVESTPLASRLDPEDFSEVMRRYQDAASTAIRRFGGHLAQVVGDGLVVYFGYPQAREDDPERAVRAGLAIVDAMLALNADLQVDLGERLSIRVGVHTGLIVIGQVDDSPARDQLATGDAMHIASRLEGVAEPDTVVMSETTLRLAPGIFTVEDKGLRDLKGVPEPVRVYRAVRVSGVRSRLLTTPEEGHAAFVGRERELDLLHERFALSQQGNGQTVVVSGEAGIGKSRLMQAFRQRLATTPHSWLECGGSVYAQDSALQPILELQRQGIGMQLEDAPPTKLDAIERSIEAVGFDSAEAVPLIAPLHGVPLQDRYRPLDLSPEGERERTLALLTDWVLRLSRVQPLVVLFEDLHWMDPSTLEVLEQVTARTTESSVLVLATHRPDFVSSLPHDDHVGAVTLARLRPAEVASLITSAARGRSMPRAWVNEVRRRSDGVPLFVEELTKAILEAYPDLPIDEPVTALEIPNTLHASLTARLDTLGPAKQLAQIGSVIGREVPYDVLSRLSGLSGLSERRLQQQLAEVVHKGVFHQSGRPPRSSYVFSHALIRDAAYGSMIRATRRRYHAGVAETLIERAPALADVQPELVAFHLAEAADAERSVDWWERAARREMERAAYREAVSDLLAAISQLRQLPEGTERDRREMVLQNTLGAARIPAEGYTSPDVEIAYGRARSLFATTGDTDQLAASLYGLASFNRGVNELDASLGFGEDLDELARRHASPVYAVGAAFSKIGTFYYAGDLERARQAGVHGLEHYRPADAQRTIALFGADLASMVTAYLSWTRWAQGSPSEALRHADAAVDLAKRSGDPFSLAFSLTFSSTARVMRREPDAALPLAREAVEVSRTHAIPLFHGCGRLLAAWCHQGDEGALAEFRAGIGIASGTGNQSAITLILGLFAEVTASDGHPQDALAVVQEALGIAAGSGMSFWDAELHRQRGELLLTLHPDRPGPAEVEFRAALDIARHQGARSLELRVAASLASLMAADDRRRGAKGLLAPVVEHFAESDASVDLLEAQAFLTQLS